MSFIYGVLGTLAVLALVFLSAFAGYKLRGKVDRYMAPKAERPGEDELQRIREQQKAFAELQNYSVEMAYGQTNRPYGDEGSEEI